MTRRHPPLVLAALAAPAALALLAGAGRADTLVTHDGRIITVQKARLEGDHYRLTFEVGEILCPKELVASVEIEGDMSEYEPANDVERKFLEQGYVRHRGKWMSKGEYQSTLAKEAEERRQRTAELAARADFANAYELETKRFVLRSNTNPELLEFYAELLEAYYSLMDDRIGIKPTPTLRRKRMAVNVFKSHAELMERAGEWASGGTLLGFFSRAEHSLNFYHDYKDPQLSLMVGLHECTHLLTYLIDQDFLPPIWIDEAVADYFGMAHVEVDQRGRVEIAPGQLQMDQVLTVQQALQDGRHTPLGKLLLIPRETFDGFHYAHAWSFVYFLQNTPEYARRFNRFFKSLYTLKLKGCKAETLEAGWNDKTGTRKRYAATDVRDALLAELGVKSIDQLEAEWVAFVKEIPIDGPLALFQRGYDAVQYQQGTYEEALADLDAAIAGGVETGRAYWARGLARLATGGWKEGQADFRRAVELAPLDAAYRADLAFTLARWYGDGDQIRGSDEELGEAGVQFALAAALAPENQELGELDRRYRELRAK